MSRLPLILFGAGKIAEAVTYFFERDSDYEVVAYCCDAAYVNRSRDLGRPVLSKEAALSAYPPSDCHLFVALGYQEINRLRAERVAWARAQGYRLASYRSPLVPGDYRLGDNSIVMDGAVIQPGVTLGDNVFVWGGAMIGHHAVIQDHCWLTGGCAVGGITTLGAGSFVGLNATLGHEIVIGERCMIGANALAGHSLPDGSVLIVGDTPIHRLNADQFARLSQCFRTG